jgi:flagellar biosynthesis protein FlhF
MKIKRFEGKDMEEVLKQVREEFGPEAIILSTKKLKPSLEKFNIFRSSGIEVVAAVDRFENYSKSNSSNPTSLSKSIDGSFVSEKGEEDFFIQQFLSLGLPLNFVNKFIEEIKDSQKEIAGSSIPEIYRGFLRWKLMDYIETYVPNFDKMRIWSFIGPTGVGKTTTMVKLAAQLSLTITPKITLVTIDTYRIGAIEQLKTYADILKLPMEIAHYPDELKKIIRKWDGQNLLLIDTPGRSPNQQNEIEELKGFLNIYPNIENHLVLSATTKDKDLDRIVHQFSILPIESYIFTKIDETDHFVPIFNQVYRYKRPITYLTNGQRVPEDIELATKSKVANLILKSIVWN